MTAILRACARHGVRALLYGSIVGLVLVVFVAVVYLDGRPDLSLWHEVHLDAEFTRDSDVESFADYLALEDRLFRQLDEEVYDRVDPADRRRIDRYSRGSLADPSRWPTNWNRSFELAHASPRAGVLMIHGMSDSPYSMRSLAEAVHARGARVIGLRVPGHGTAPSGLVYVSWKDMAAAVRLAVIHLRQQVGERPIVLVGYSNGGALAVHYALEALEDDALPIPDQVVLLSAEIGITKLAALAVWQERLGHVLGLRKLAWNSIQPEYDPYKYGSFALNAAIQAYSITQEIERRVTGLATTGALERFPPILAFQSVVDATVSAPALVTGLLEPLAGPGHELVLFDINRTQNIEPLLKRSPDAWLHDIVTDETTPFAVTLVTNESERSSRVIARRREAGSSAIADSPLDLDWPRDVYSLTHVALPFPPDDPLYGGPDAPPSPGISLGRVSLRGERGVLVVSASDMLRLRWNPFHDYVERRVIEAIDARTP